MGIVIGLGIGGMILAGLFWQIDDWKRDLTKNYAQTSENAADPLLRPVQSSLSSAEAAEMVQAAVAALPRWQFLEVRQEDGHQVLHFVRTTRLMRWKDDIYVTITPTATGSIISAESQSRVGKGDLGQNPRNLKELMGLVHPLLLEKSR